MSWGGSQSRDAVCQNIQLAPGFGCSIKSALAFAMGLSKIWKVL